LSLYLYIRVRTVHKKTDRTQYPIIRPQFPPTQDPIRFTRALMHGYLQTPFSLQIFAKCMLQISYVAYFTTVCKCYLHLFLFFCFISINWTLLWSLFCLFLFTE